MRERLVILPVLASLSILAGSCATETVEDRRYGQQLVCHDGRKTLTVSNADSFVHLNHGDSAGPCPGNTN